MCSCWQENPDNRPTFETLYMRFDEFMIQAEPSYREVKTFFRSHPSLSFPMRFSLDVINHQRQASHSLFSELSSQIDSSIQTDCLLTCLSQRQTTEFSSFSLLLIRFRSHISIGTSHSIPTYFLLNFQQ